MAEVRALPRSETEKALPVRLRGVVTWKEEDFVIQDESAGIYVNMSVARTGVAISVAEGAGGGHGGGGFPRVDFYRSVYPGGTDRVACRGARHRDGRSG